MKSQMGFSPYNSQGADKNGATCNMVHGRETKIYLCMSLSNVVDLNTWSHAPIPSTFKIVA